jgi:LPXTG-motif cell wall-anchored protein
MLNIKVSNRIRNAFISMLSVAIFGLVSVTPSLADEWDKKTVITFSGPVEIPGQVLPAGTYVFKLANSDSDRHIVQVFDKDQKHLYGTILAIPDYRMQPTGKTVIRFEERTTGSPEAVKAWFYPGDLYGQEFVYPKARATEIAMETNQNVLSTTSNESSEQAMENAPVTAVSPSENEETAQAAPIQEENTETAATATENNSEQNMPATADREVAENTAPAPAPPSRLPKTGSELPLMSLIGASSLGAAMLTKLLRRVL